MKKLPLYALDLIKELDKQMPLRPVSILQSEREIFYEAGRRSVIDYLLTLKRQAEAVSYTSEPGDE